MPGCALASRGIFLAVAFYVAGFMDLCLGASFHTCLLGLEFVSDECRSGLEWLPLQGPGNAPAFIQRYFICTTAGLLVEVFNPDVAFFGACHTADPISHRLMS